MSITTDELARPIPSQPAAPGTPHGRVTLAHVIRSEWIKFRTLRSSWATLSAAMLALIVLGLVIGYNIGKNYTGLAPEDAAASGPLQGYHGAQLLIGVLGVLFVSGEYSTGMIRSTLAAVPRRVPVLAAKAIVFGSIALVTMVASTFAAYFGAQLFLAHYGHGGSLSDPGALRAVIGTGVYLALIGLLGGALGWIVRNTAGGISSLVGLLLVVPVLFQVLPGAWASDILKYLPSEAGSAFVTSVSLPGTLTPAVGFGVLVAWVAAAMVTAVVLLRRRDA
jgi:ABC-type transport system involved in multi-copper enzyme maturation permease subunit